MIPVARDRLLTFRTAARAALKRKKQHEHTLDQTLAQISTIEQQIYSIEAANINRETLAAMERAGQAMKQIHGKLNIDMVDQTMYAITHSPSFSPPSPFLIPPSVERGGFSIFSTLRWDTTTNTTQGGPQGAALPGRGDRQRHHERAAGRDDRRGRPRRRARGAGAGGPGQQDAQDGPHARVGRG